jgi:hypothetical protein
MSIGTGRPGRSDGAALVIMLVVVVLGALSAGIGALDLALVRAPSQREALTRAVLEEAKAALVAFAADNRNRPGGLPCPDRDGDGEAELACDRPEQRVGLYPWQTLRAGRLRDASGAPLWYAVSARFRNDPDVAINSHTDGELVVDGVAGAAAVILAPEAALPGQSRAGSPVRHRAAYLEGTNAGSATRFGTRDGGGNDMIAPLTPEQLFTVVDPVVASRIRAEIVPVLVRAYADAWGALPYAVPFDDPRRSPLLDAARTRTAAGLLPIAPDPTWVHWDVPTVTASIDGEPADAAIVDCSRSIATEIRCTVRHRPGARLALAATAHNVGHALVRPPRTVEEEFGGEGLTNRRIDAGRPAADGAVRIVAHADLGGHRGRTTVRLVAPLPIRELVDRRAAVGAPGAWFARNEWYRTLLYRASPEHLPGGGGRRDCEEGIGCVIVADARGEHAAAGALVFAGRARRDGDRSTLGLLDAHNAAPIDGVLRDTPALHAGNDAVFALCPATMAPCVIGR